MLQLKISRRSLSIALSAAALSLGLAVPASAAPEITLKYAFFAPEGTFPGQQMMHWAEEMKKRTNGKVEVQTFPGGTLLGAREMWDGVTMGITDIGLSAPSYDPGRFPLSAGLTLPLGFPDATTANRVLWEVTNEFEPKEFERFKVIAMFTSEPGYLMTREPVRSRDDLKGMRVRATGSGVPVINALGGSAVGMPMPEVPQAVQTGVVQGVMTSREVLQDFRLAESLKYVTNYPMVGNTFAAVMDKKRYEKLPDDVKQVIEELSHEMHAWTGDYHDNKNIQGAIEWSIKEHGLEIVELSEGEREQWDAALQPLVEQWITEANKKGLPGDKYIARVVELRDQQ